VQRAYLTCAAFCCVRRLAKDLEIKAKLEDPNLIRLRRPEAAPAEKEDATPLSLHTAVFGVLTAFFD